MIDAVSSFAASVRVCCAVGEAVWAVTTQNALVVYHPTSFYSATAVELDIRGSGATCLVGLVQCMLAVPTRYTRHTKGSGSSRRRSNNEGEDERGDMTLWLGTSAGELLYISDVGRISDQLTSAVPKQSTTLSATRTPPLAPNGISGNGYGNTNNNNNDNVCEVMPTRLYRRSGRYVVKATMLSRLPSEARPSAIVSMDYAGPFRRSSSSASPLQRFSMRRGGEERGVADVDAGTNNTDGHTNTVHSYSYAYDDKDNDSRTRAEEALVWVAIGCACGVVVLLDHNNNADEAPQPVVRLVRHLRAPCTALRFLSHRGPPMLAAGDAEGGVYLWDFTSLTCTAGRKGTSLVPVSCLAGATSSCASASSCAAARSLPNSNNNSDIGRSAPLSRPVEDASTHSSNNNSVDACGADQDGPPLLLYHHRDDDTTTRNSSSNSKGVDQLLYHAGTLWVARRNTQIDLYTLHRTYATTNMTQADMERLLESDQWPMILTLALQYRIEARARVTALLALPPRTVLARTAAGRLIAFDAKTFAVVRRVPCATAATATTNVDDDDVEGGAEKEKCGRRNTSSSGGGSGALVVVRQRRTFEVWSCAPQHGAVKVWRVTSAVEGDGHDNPSCYHHDDCDDDNYYYYCCWHSDDGSYIWPGREAWRWASLRQSVASQSGAQGKSEAEGERDTQGQRESATSPHTMMMKKTAIDDKDGNSSSGNDPCHTKAQVGDGMTRREEVVYNTTTNRKQQEEGEDWFTYAAARDAAWHASAESLRRSRDEAQELRLRLLRGQAEKDAAVQEELRQRTHHNAELQRQLSSLTQKLTEMTSQVALVEKDRVALQQEMTQVKNELAQARREASEALASRTLAEREAARHAADSALLTRRVEEASREVTSLRTEQTTLLHRLAQKEQQQQLLLRDQCQAQPITSSTTVTGDKSAGEDRLQHALAEATQRQQMLSDALSSALYTVRRLELEHDDLAALLQAYQDKLRCALQPSRASVIHTSHAETPLTALLLATMVRHPARFELGGVDAATKEALLDRHGPFLQFLHRLHRDDSASYARLMRTLQSAGQSTSQETKTASENEEQGQKREEERVNIAAADKTTAGCTTQETWQERLRQMMACEGVHGLAGQNATLQMLWNAVNGVPTTTTGSQESNANTNSSGPNNDTSHISPPPSAVATTTTTTTNVSGGGVVVTADGAGTHNECPATCGAAAMTAPFSLQRGLPSLLTTRPPPSASFAAQGIATMGPGSSSASAPPPLACVQPGMTITALSNTHNAQASLITTTSSSGGGGNNNNNNTNNVVDNNTKNGTGVSAGTSAAATTTTTISTGGLSSTANTTTATREAALLRPAVGPSSPSPSSATTNTIITATAGNNNNNSNNSGITGTMNNGTGDANANDGVSRMPALPSTASCLPPVVQTSDSSFLAAAGPAAAVTNNNNNTDSVSKGVPSEPGRLGEASKTQLVLGLTEGNRTDNNNTTDKNSSNNEPRSDTTRPTTTTTTTDVVSYADVEAELGRLREVYRTFEFVLATRPGLVERLAQLYEHLRRAQGAVATFAALHPMPDADSSSSRYDGSHCGDDYACHRRTNMNRAPYHTTSSSINSNYPVNSGRRDNAMSSFTTTTTNAPPSQTHYRLMDDTLRASDGVVRAMLCDTLTELAEMFSVLITGYLTDAEKQRLQL